MKPKRVSYELLTPAEHPAIYKLLASLVVAHHDEIATARIALAWCTSWRADVDGHQKLGQCKKASDLDRELAEYDFVILLQKEFWENEAVSDTQRQALLDHELCHATVKLDSHTLEPLEDERGRIVYRLRKHDLEEFVAIAARYGTWKRDLERFARALASSKQASLPLEAPEEVPS
jgi:hypothetical protein